MWDCPIIQIANYFMTSFKLVTQSCTIPQDMFATTLINSEKFVAWKEVYESPYILYKFT
jgi:hypothetical protein